MPAPDWSMPRHFPALAPRQVHLWRIPLEGSPPSEAWRLLSHDERQRAERLQREGPRRRFVLARSALRRILGLHLDCEPEHLFFGYGPHGKPHLWDETVQFNLSHSQDWALVAVTRSVAVGVDVERVAPRRPIDALARRFFSEAEVAEFTALPPDLRVRAFFHTWACKEAFIKAIGEGLTHPLKRFDVRVDPRRPAELRAVRPKTAEAWSLHALPMPEGYAAAVAVPDPRVELALWEWPTG